MIIDAHTHFYDPSRPQGVPWPSPKNKALYRTVLPEHFKAVATPHGVTGTIVVEASTWIDDNAWILELAERDPFIVGVVGRLEPGSPDFPTHLDRFAANPLFLGIRVSGQVVERAETPAVLADLERLAAEELELDVLIQPRHLPAIASIAKRLPALRIVINHVACVPIDDGPPPTDWIDGIRSVAEYPNVFCKVSGLASMTRQNPAPTDPAIYVPTLDVLWNALGEDRLIFGSDWPVCAQVAKYADVLRVVADYFRAKGDEAAEKYFWKNSKTAYKWTRRPHNSDAGR